MNWKTIRLELGSTPEHPRGSASRAYLIRLPVDEAGIIDEAALRGRPHEATVRRFWPSEPDRAGLVERAGSDWVFRCSRGPKGEKISSLGAGPLRLGGQILVTEGDGRSLPFRVRSIVQLP